METLDWRYLRATSVAIWADDTILAVRGVSLTDEHWNEVCIRLGVIGYVSSPAVQVDEETIARLTVRIEQLEKGMKKC